MGDKNLQNLAVKLSESLLKNKLRCVVAESCTGGGLSSIITDIPGSSEWFERGFVCYSNESKNEMLGVPLDILQKFGAVSEETAKAMAEGALKNSHAEISVAITGIAGPSGGTKDKPVGTVWISWASNFFSTIATCYHFSGGRIKVRAQAIETALEGLIKHCQNMR